LERIRNLQLNRYPDPRGEVLRDALREAMQVPDTMQVMLGNGSDELIQVILLAMGGPGRKALAPVPTFVMYEMIAAFTGTEFIGVPLRPDFSLDGDAMLSAVREHDPAVVFVAYPNNPTGNLFDRDALLALLDACSGLVVLDEAYYVFARQSLVEELDRFENLVVLRTLSKMGLAGLRLGYLVGAQGWLAEFDKVRLPYNINVLSQVTAEFALQNAGVFDEQANRICRERARVAKILTSLEALRVFPSDANFLLLRCEQHDADQVFGGLLQQEILVKNLHRNGTALEGCLRVTIGKPHENDAFLNVLSVLVG
jgi:histidinol-phosphate aminotransferase